MNRRFAITGTVMLFSLGLVLVFLPTPSARAQNDPGTERPKRVVKSDREWAKVLTRQQSMVSRLKYTDPAFSGKYVNSHAKGTYVCVCCETPLFSSRTKFHSGTGWPSFYQPLDRQAIATAPDHEGAEPRIEVMCSICGAHLGHVFADGPPPTGLRFCVNSSSLKFAPASAPSAAKKTTKSKAKTKTSAKTSRTTPAVTKSAAK